VAKRTQHVAPNNVAICLAGAFKCWANNVEICCAEKLRSFDRGLTHEKSAFELLYGGQFNPVDKTTKTEEEPED